MKHSQRGKGGRICLEQSCYGRIHCEGDNCGLNLKLVCREKRQIKSVRTVCSLIDANLAELSQCCRRWKASGESLQEKYLFVFLAVGIIAILYCRREHHNKPIDASSLPWSNSDTLLNKRKPLSRLLILLARGMDIGDSRIKYGCTSDEWQKVTAGSCNFLW